MAPANKTYRDSHFYSVYFAPRGRFRMLEQGMMLAQRHLTPLDKLVGVIGEAGSGKSMLVKGMFPGLELSNDDMGVNVRPLPILNSENFHSFYASHTFHLDVRFEMAFTSLPVLADAVRAALDADKRVVVEHFDLLFPVLGMNAELLIGLGAEILVTRPTFFGPEPGDITKIVFASQKYRKMAHTAENLTERFLAEYGTFSYMHADVHHGFVLEFDEKPDVNLPELERRVKENIAKDEPVSFYDENHILFGDVLHYCTGPRIHVGSTGQIENFSLFDTFLYDPRRKSWLLVGLVGEADRQGFGHLNRVVR